MSGPLTLAWGPRARPLEPTAVFAAGPAAAALLRRLGQRSEEALGALRGVAAAPGSALPFVLVLGEAALLPWADGVLYLGRDPAAPSLLLPTAASPLVPLALVERALLQRAPAQPPPLAVLPAPWGLVVPVGEARPLSRARLALAA
jgi:hypothetical protein